MGLDISVEYQSWPPRVFSDDTGRYRVPNTSLSGPLKIIAEMSGYKQPCRVSVMQTGADQDLYVVPDASIVLDFSGGLGWGPVASTVTDATGRYVLCNMGTPVLGIYAYVSKPGYRPAFVPVTPGQTGSF